MRARCGWRRAPAVLPPAGPAVDVQGLAAVLGLRDEGRHEPLAARWSHRRVAFDHA